MKMWTRITGPGVLAFLVAAAGGPLIAATPRFFGPDIRLFAIQPAEYRDLDGDHDRFPDTGETGRLTIRVQNIGPPLTGVIAALSSTDPGVACLTDWSMRVGDLATGQVVTIGSLDPALPGFTFRTSDGLASLSPTKPARLNLCLSFMADGYQSFSDFQCFDLVADLNLPQGASQTFVTGPDGVTPSPDDGTVRENFDVDRDGDGLITVNDTFRLTDDGTGLTEHGSYLHGTNIPGIGAVVGIACQGYQTPAEGNPSCIIDPRGPMDWHLHCPPGAGNCPNSETGTCIGACDYESNLPLALSAPNSLHMGAHYRPQTIPSDPGGSTTHFRSLQAFVSSPINLAAVPRPGDLDLSMFHIARLADDHNGIYQLHYGKECLDCADVQIQVDGDPDPAVDAWGFWEKLVPYQNIYDHHSVLDYDVNYLYCAFTPNDAGTAPPAPRGFHETMCYPQGAWSHCGDESGTTPSSNGDCVGPAQVGSSGQGVWAETRFNLANYVGQRVRVRWIGSTWDWQPYSSYSTYHESPSGYPWLTWDGDWDDGWWLDDITFTGALTRQVSPLVDTAPPPGGSCPASLCVDADGDGYGAGGSPPCPPGIPLDCDDASYNTHPGGLEWNDGRDNDCPGDPGFGLIDDITNPVFLQTSVSFSDWLYFYAQPNARTYQVARSDRPDFVGDCVVTLSSDYSSRVDIPGEPPVGAVYYYLVRAFAPRIGSWGADSSGKERTGICGL
ncbi:MAG TPA: hypothetical protein VFB49_10970 [Patescibacteria group bacterium]|nr:hypothetical protein [Patescibacteria group bacterium]